MERLQSADMVDSRWQASLTPLASKGPRYENSVALPLFVSTASGFSEFSPEQTGLFDRKQYHKRRSCETFSI